MQNYSIHKLQNLSKELKDSAEWLAGLAESFKRYIPYNPASSTNEMLRQKVLEKESPELYYAFRLSEKVVEIVGNCVRYDNNNPVRDYSTWFYHVHCVGFTPELKGFLFDKDFKRSRLTYLNDCFYGNFDTLDEAIVWYKRIIFDVLNTGGQIELFTSCVNEEQDIY